MRWRTCLSIPPREAHCMCSLSHNFRARFDGLARGPGCVLAVAVLIVASAAISSGKESRVLRVAADPNNLPFSNERREGFENKIIDLIARELGATTEYTWHA